jgi:predicted transcriptional regulator
MPAKKHFTITEAAKKLRISRQAVHEAIAKGQLEAKRGKLVKTVTVQAWLISAAALKAYRVSFSHKRRGKKSTVA